MCQQTSEVRWHLSYNTTTDDSLPSLASSHHRRKFILSYVTFQSAKSHSFTAHSRFYCQIYTNLAERIASWERVPIIFFSWQLVTCSDSVLPTPTFSIANIFYLQLFFFLSLTWIFYSLCMCVCVCVCIIYISNTYTSCYMSNRT